MKLAHSYDSARFAASENLQVGARPLSSALPKFARQDVYQFGMTAFTNAGYTNHTNSGMARRFSKDIVTYFMNC